jgi:hypothetical protein
LGLEAFPVRGVTIYMLNHLFWRISMLVKLFGGLTLAASLLFGGLGAAEEKPAATDCCAKKLACCGKDKACCAATAKTGCCARGMKCCAQERACCTSVQECCKTGAACCDEAKACCGPTAPKDSQEAAKGCCASGKCYGGGK